jgi:hypothetical protein
MSMQSQFFFGPQQLILSNSRCQEDNSLLLPHLKHLCDTRSNSVQNSVDNRSTIKSYQAPQTARCLTNYHPCCTLRQWKQRNETQSIFQEPVNVWMMKIVHFATTAVTHLGDHAENEHNQCELKCRRFFSCTNTINRLPHVLYGMRFVRTIQ